MNEATYWASLEYRVGREFAGMLDGRLRCLWCDGFLPEQYLLDDNRPRITGRAWICKGSQQEEWEFTFLLPNPVGSLNEIDWASLLPPDNVTRWLSLDQTGMYIEIDPAAAVPDLVKSKR